MARRTLHNSTVVVASRWMTRTAFNKENPVDLVSQLVKVLERAAESSDEDAAHRLHRAVDSVREVSREVQTAWRRRTER